MELDDSRLMAVDDESSRHDTCLWRRHSLTQSALIPPDLSMDSRIRSRFSAGSAMPGACHEFRLSTIQRGPTVSGERGVPAPGTINIALLGVDKRPTKNFNNTDVIVIASINPDIPSVTLLSISRDWPAHIPGVGTQKINTAFAIGRPKLFRDTLMRNFGLRIDYYAMVNFEGLV